MTKSVTWNFLVNDSQENAWYDMFLGQDILLEL